MYRDRERDRARYLDLACRGLLSKCPQQSELGQVKTGARTPFRSSTCVVGTQEFELSSAVCQDPAAGSWMVSRAVRTPTWLLAP